MGNVKIEVDDRRLLGVFDNKVRVEIVKLLLEFRSRGLSEIAERLGNRGWRMTLSGVLEHLRQLEKAGVVLPEPGIFGEEPDARRTTHFLEGRDRVEQVLQHLKCEMMNPLRAGLIFAETAPAKIARQIQGIKVGLIGKEIKRLESTCAHAVYNKEPSQFPQQNTTNRHKRSFLSLQPNVL